MNFHLPIKINTHFKPSRRVLFALALLAVVGVSVLSYWNTSRLIVDEQRVAFTYGMIAKLNSVSAAVNDAETDIRGYIVAGVPNSNALNTVETKLIAQVQELEPLAATNPYQQQRVDDLQQTIKEYFTDLSALVERSNNDALSFDKALIEQQMQFAASTQQIIDQMSAETNRFLLQHQNTSNATEQTTFITLFLISVGSVLVLGFIFYSLNQEITKRIRIAGAMTESEQRLRTQYKSLPVPTYTWRKTDDDLVLVDYNDAALEASSGRVSELLGKKAKQLYADTPEIAAMLQRCHDEQTTLQRETPYRFRSTGAERYMDVTCVFVAPDSVMVHTEDTTDRRQAQEDATSDHNLLRTVIDILPDYIFAKDKEGRFSLTNIAHAQSVKVDPTNMLGKTAYDLWPQMMAEQFSLDDELILQTGKTLINVERETQDAEGNKRRVLTSKVPLRDDQNNVIGLVGISRDITELTKTQTALQESEELSRAIIGALTEAVVFRYANGTVGFMNPSAERLTESLMKDEAGQPLFFNEDGSLLNQEERPSAIALGTGTIHEYMLMSVKRLDGERRWMSFNAQPLFHAGEDIPYATVSSFSDVTETMQLEQALQESLEQALEASRAKSTFLATMSHEIRTPMNGVIGMTDLVLDTPLGDEQREMIEIIRISANSLLTIINDILDFSKIEAGKLTLENIEFQPVTLVEGAADIVVAKAHEKKLSLMTYVDPAIPSFLSGDSLRLQQILINLLGNAVKFTEQGDVVVRATLERLTKTQATVRFSVNDTGIGLSETVRLRLFQPFMQADDSMTRKYGGTGLGLAICARLVELMNGEIGVESQEGTGSYFWFSVPLPISAKTTDTSVNLDLPLDLNGLRVLVADSSVISREIIVSYLSKWNSLYECAADGETALRELVRASAANLPYDVVILDSILADGFELPNLDKQDVWFSSTHFVALSDHPRTAQAPSTREFPFETFLSKPVKQLQLLQTLSNFSRQRVQRIVVPPAAKVTTITEKYSQILLVEDNAINQKVAAMQLRKLGLSVQTASDGQGALDSLMEGNYSLILMDCQMPGIDGFEATRRIRKNEADSTRHIPIVAMTANAMQGDRELCLAAGMDDYISKPIDLSQLEIVLKKWLSA